MANLIFLIIFALSFFTRLDAIKGGSFPFTTDQGRDMVDIRSIAVTHKPRLIGPTTSINGVYLGPFWYYFNLPPFLVTQGNPTSLLVWQISWYQFAGLLIYLFLKKPNPHLAFFTSVFFLIMPLGFNTSRYSWNANAMPIFSALFLLTLYLVKQQLTAKRLVFLGLLAGLSFQIEAAFGILFFPFSLLLLATITRKIKSYIFLSGGFIFTLIPQALFEIRHLFPLTRVFLSEITGQSSLLGQKLSFTARFADRFNIVTKLIQDISHLRTTFLYPIFILGLTVALWLIRKKKLTHSVKYFILLNFSFVFFALLFFLLFPQVLKSWYLLGLSVPLVFLYAASLSLLFGLKFPLAKVAVAIIVVASFYETFTAQVSYLKIAPQMGLANKSSLINSLTEIDWVYQHADNQGFKAYSYLASVYDYPYQYLYWWYGGQKYGYRPNDVAYLPDQPEYLENRTRYFTPTKPLPANEPTFLIIEKEKQNPVFETAWLGNFSKLCLAEKTDFSYGVEIRKLTLCPKK